ncbi:MAG: zinc-ribbon domain-containing protein [Deltaproteobacteria bacterium]|nr:zinc-ribbon domain-containing protein [Deltaproteobacteria bacterium]
MIVTCEKCQSKFRLEDGLVKEGGTKVRCSLCRHVFTAYPSESVEPGETEDTHDVVEETLKETVALDAPPGQEEAQPEPLGGEEKEADRGEAEKIAEEELQDFSFGEEEGAVEEGAVDFGEDEMEETEAEPEPSGDVEETSEPSTAPKRGRSKAVPIVLIIILLLLLGGAYVYFFKPDIITDFLPVPKKSPQEEIKDSGVSRLTFPTVSGAFVESQKADQLFVIRGMVTNNYPKPRSFIYVKGSLLDDRGKVVKIKKVYAGNSVPDEELKSMSMADIDQILNNKNGKGNMNIGILPGNSIPIMIVFDQLPENLSEFTVEAVSSSPSTRAE